VCGDRLLTSKGRTEVLPVSTHPLALLPTHRLRVDSVHTLEGVHVANKIGFQLQLFAELENCLLTKVLGLLVGTGNQTGGNGATDAAARLPPCVELWLTMTGRSCTILVHRQCGIGLTS
jgi:hypothetical protein